MLLVNPWFQEHFTPAELSRSDFAPLARVLSRKAPTFWNWHAAIVLGRAAPGGASLAEIKSRVEDLYRLEEKKSARAALLPDLPEQVLEEISFQALGLIVEATREDPSGPKVSTTPSPYRRSLVDGWHRSE